MSEPNPETFRLIDLLLAQQQQMTPVELFAQSLAVRSAPSPPAFHQLIPLSKPALGEQYAFTVDLDKCSGCKACVSACHSLNGLEEGEIWRNTGLIVGERRGAFSPGMKLPFLAKPIPYQQTVTSSCHHCVEPACATGCPVLAYEKDPETGIVRHLDDQCIGCQYCILKCPYDVPKYSAKKGIVRKCDMCHGRLSAGEAPACVQACPSEAIRIDIVKQEVARACASIPGARMISGAHDSNHTIPTTRYESRKPVPLNARPVNADFPRLQPAHWPLIGMLLLTQLAAGSHLINAVLLSSGVSALSGTLAALGGIALVAGMVVSVFHLGRPLKAWRAFLGWRRSWMSREIIAFMAYAMAAGALLFRPTNLLQASFASVPGLAAVFCSAMIYVDTGRSGWSGKVVFVRFFGTSLLSGTTAAGLLSILFSPPLAVPLLTASILIRAATFSWEMGGFLMGMRDPTSELHQIARATLHFAGWMQSARVALFLLAMFFSFVALSSRPSVALLSGAIVCLSTFLSQLFERWLFFTTVLAPRMPGGVPA